MADLLSHGAQQSQRAIRIRAAASGGAMFLFYLSMALFFISLASYGGLLLLNRAQDSAREERRVQIQEKELALQSSAVDQILAFDARLTTLRTLLKDHVFPSNVLAFVEGTTHPEVQFLNFKFGGETRRADMSGVASSYAVVSQQLRFFEQNPLVEQVDFGGLSLSGEGLVKFNVTLVLSPQLLELAQ